MVGSSALSLRELDWGYRFGSHCHFMGWYLCSIGEITQESTFVGELSKGSSLRVVAEENNVLKVSEKKQNVMVKFFP